MAHFAELNDDNVVIRVIVVDNAHEADGENFCHTLFGGRWKKTSYNSRGDVHYNSETNEPDGLPAFRKNYAGIGYTYDAVRDAFIPPQPYPSWALNETTCLWDAPVSYPTNGNFYIWDEQTLSWVVTLSS